MSFIRHRISKNEPTGAVIVPNESESKKDIRDTEESTNPETKKESDTVEQPFSGENSVEEVLKKQESIVEQSQQPIVEKPAKKPPVKTRKAKRTRDDYRGLELNATNGELDGNVMIARNFKAICKLKGLKINHTLGVILTEWIKKNQIKPPTNT